MTSEQSSFLNQRHLPSRLTARETGWLLGFSPHDVKVLTSKGYLKPMGKPVQNSTKFYCTAIVARLCGDAKWLDRATTLLNRHWRSINGRRTDTEGDE